MKPALFISLLLLVGCQLSAQPSDSWTNSTFEAITISHPASWSANKHNDGYIAFQSPNGARMVMWPLFMGRKLTPSSAATVARQLAGRVESNATWSGAQPLRPGRVRLQGMDGDRSVIALMDYSVGRGGSGAMLYLVSAPNDDFPSDTFGQMAGSLKIEASEIPMDEKPAIKYRAWSDPNENAFTVEVPQEWQVDGGMIRVAAVDTRPQVRMQSQDGAILVFGGDAQVPPFAIPNQALTFAGFPEGSWYSPGYGVSMMVRSYQGGVKFAEAYAQTFSEACGGHVEITDSRDRPETAETLNEIAAQFGGVVSQRLDAGDVVFRCGNRVGYVFAMTRLITQPQYGMGMWNMEQLYGFFANSDRSAEAQDVLAHVANSMRLNPEWAQMQSGLVGNVTKIVAETSAHISGLVRDAYEFKSASEDRIYREFGEYIRGVENIVDPVTGETYEVQSGSNHYWVSRLGQVVGTDIYENPEAMLFNEAFVIN